MKIKILSLILMIFIGISAFAQTTPTAVITGNAVGVIGPGGTIYPVSLQIQLTGCGAQVPLVPGGSVVTNFYKQSAPGPSYSATITAYGNDIITCGTQSYTTYAATWLINNQPAAPTATYRLVQGQTCNISDGSCKPIGFVPPVIARGAGLFCATGQQLMGFNADYTPNCVGFTTSALPTFRTNSVTNSDQTILNLIATGGLTAIASGGNITLTGSGLISKTPSATQLITQPSATNLNVVTSGGGQLQYNGTEVLTTATGATTFILKAPAAAQTITQPINTDLNVVTSGTGTERLNGSEILSRATGIASTPTTNQTVTQPTNTSLNVTALNNEVNASLFPGADLGAKIVNAIAASPSTHVVIRIPASSTSYTWNTLVTIDPRNVSIIGSGSMSTLINCTQPLCLDVTEGTFTIENSGIIGGFSLTGNATNNQIGIRSCCAQNLTYEDIQFSGFTGTNAISLSLNNTNLSNGWQERLNLKRIRIHDQGVGVKFDYAIANPAAGSFGYSLIDVTCDSAGASGCVWMSNGRLYGSIVNIQGNIAVGGILLNVTGTGDMDENQYSIFAEPLSTGATCVSVTGLALQGTGTIACNGATINNPSGVTFNSKLKIIRSVGQTGTDPSWSPAGNVSNFLGSGQIGRAEIMSVRDITNPYDMFGAIFGTNIDSTFASFQTAGLADLQNGFVVYGCPFQFSSIAACAIQGGIMQGGFVEATTGFAVGTTKGFNGTAVISGCTLTISGGIITGKTGSC